MVRFSFAVNVKVRYMVSFMDRKQHNLLYLIIRLCRWKITQNKKLSVVMCVSDHFVDEKLQFT